MSVNVQAWAYELVLPPGPKAVLVALAWHADDEGQCYPGQRRLADMTGYNRRSVLRSLAALEALEAGLADGVQGRAGALVNRAAHLGRLIRQAAHGPRDERIIIGHLRS